ncbi:MAG: hypothetical protein GTN99_10160 [Candidatus Dadabacteria bacterium]|nr:hypothetical protein [Candidatus Dadabacteria bacterium]
MPKTPDHLGGHIGVTHIDKGSLEYLNLLMGVNSVLDIGCGPGGMKKVCDALNMTWTGIDGDPAVEDKVTLLHDYNNGPSPIEGRFDLGWCCAVLEHIEEQYIPNVVKDLKKCKYLMVFPDDLDHGYHHVFCRNKKWWAEYFKKLGYERNTEVELELDKATTMLKKRIWDLRMFFYADR